MIDDTYREDLEKLVEKIRTIVIYSENLISNDIDIEETKRKYNIVSKALKNKTDLVIEYKKKKKIITPHNFSFYKDLIYITGYSKNDDDLRTYNLNEINIE